jgi:hypothetical protein
VSGKANFLAVMFSIEGRYWEEIEKMSIYNLYGKN